MLKYADDANCEKYTLLVVLAPQQAIQIFQLKWNYEI